MSITAPLHCGVFGRPKSRSPFVRVVLALWACVIGMSALSGCASSSGAARAGSTPFPAAYSAVLDEYRGHFTELQGQAKGVLGKDMSSQLAVFDNLATLTHDTLTKLDTLRPPDSLRDLLGRVRTSMVDQEAALRLMVGSARSGDQAGLNKALRDYASALQNGASLQRELAQAASATPSHS